MLRCPASFGAGGSLQGGTLTAGDVDVDTCGGGINIKRLMGSHVQVSGEDTATSAADVGSIRIGAVYANTLVLKSGEPAHSLHGPLHMCQSASCSSCNNPAALCQHDTGQPWNAHTSCVSIWQGNVRGSRAFT